MPDIDAFFDEIDDNRSRRARELSEIKSRFAGAADPMSIGSKSVVVLAYSHWEGFYNDCVESYVKFLKARGGRIRDMDWMMLAGAMVGEFQALHDKKNSHDARRRFVERLQLLLDCGYDRFPAEVVMARSNLDFDKLTGNYQILKFDIGPLQQYRLKIDQEIVKWRHQVAHGGQPDLSAMDISRHLDLVARLLLLVSDHFQAAMLERLPANAAP